MNPALRVHIIDLGYDLKPKFEVNFKCFRVRLRHLREYLSVLMPLVRGEAVGFDGEVYSTHAGLAIPDARAFPVLIAALGPQMLAVTGAMADGTITWCTGPLTLRDHIVPTLNAATDAAGRPPAADVVEKG
jgi:alkanesulfonate monooxygenase SsuD/methylene tetrahydromethanopterin reductase-like flavin-dependent oxidoreductase (luciferase family)